MTLSPKTTEIIEQTAAVWVLRRDRGLTPAEQDEFLQWLATDPRHSAAFARHQRNYSRLDQLATWRPEHGPRPNPDLLAPPSTTNIFWIREHRLAVAAFAAAAMVVLGVFLTLSRPVLPVPAHVAPPINLTTIEQRTLDDGSVIELNRGAQLSVLYTPTERRVRLERGEAHFTVVRNPGRPFIVTAGTVSVRAVGTAFNVRLAVAAVEVLVTDGVVQVAKPAEPLLAGVPSGRSTGGSSTTLNAGEHAVVSLANVAAPKIATLTPAELDTALAWQPKLLDFTDTPLTDIVAEFNRRNPVHIVLADSAAGETPISASLRSDNVEGFVRLLEAGFGVKAERRGDTITLRKAQ